MNTNTIKIAQTTATLVNTNLAQAHRSALSLATQAGGSALGDAATALATALEAVMSAADDVDAEVAGDALVDAASDFSDAIQAAALEVATDAAKIVADYATAEFAHASDAPEAHPVRVLRALADLAECGCELRLGDGGQHIDTRHPDEGALSAAADWLADGTWHGTQETMSHSAHMHIFLGSECLASADWRAEVRLVVEC
jgi:hypothetical protein